VELIATLSQLADLVSAPSNQGSALVADPAVFARVHRRLSPAERAELAQAYGEDQTVMALADRFEISRTTVLKVLHNEGVPIPYRKMGSAELDEARRLYETGWSFARVGAHLGVDPTTVHKAFQRAGIPSRPRVGR
jgi:DNA-directed RNA polymerase specialized sigma24 family protein